MHQNIPNILTALRIISIPVIVCTFYFDDSKFGHKLGASLFLFAGLTDFLDGYLARRFNSYSELGRMFDPIADKLLVAAVILMLVRFDRANEIPCLLILLREFLVAGLREFLAQLHVSIPVSNLAKTKTTVQMIALFILILGSKGSGIALLDTIGHAALWIAALLTIVTGTSYFIATMQHIKER